MTSPGLQLPLGVRWLRAPNFSSFAPGRSTEAVAAIQQAGLTHAPPILLHGPSGSGKSHLLQAAARQAHEQGRRAAYLPLPNNPAALEGYDRFDFLSLDECETVADNPQLAVALARLVDGLRTAGAGVVLASRKSPAALENTIPADLHTRLLACTVYGLQPLSDTDLSQALQRQADARGLMLAPDVAEYLIHRLPRDMPNMMAVLDRLDHASLSAGRRLTIPFVQQHLHQANSPHAPAPSSAQTESG